MANPIPEDDFDELDYWRLCDELSIYEAALLTVGKSPGEFPYVENGNTDKRPKGYEATKSAIKNALRGGRIKGTIEPETGSDFNGNEYPIRDSISLTSRVCSAPNPRLPIVSSFYTGQFSQIDRHRKSRQVIWMQNITVTWLMRLWTQGDPIMVSLVQTAMFLPVMMLSLPAGLIADRADRQRLLIVAHVVMTATPVVIAGAMLAGYESPTLLLLMTIALAAGNALKLPTQSALLPDLVPASQMPAAVGLNSLAVNGGRVAGPIISAGLLPFLGPIALLFGNAFTYFSFVIILLRLKLGHSGIVSRARSSLGEDIQELATFTLSTEKFRAVLLRSGLYFAAWSTVLAILPLIVTDAREFGLVYANFGLGSIIGALAMEPIRRHLGNELTLSVAILGHATFIAGLSLFESTLFLSASLFSIGAMSFYAMSAFQIAAQTSLPRHLRGRGLALMTTVMMGATALSSPFWGLLAEMWSPQTALQAAALFSAIGLAFTYRKKVIG